MFKPAITKSTVGLGNVDNTSDAAKPISTAMQTALNTKEPTVTVGTTSQYWRGDKSWRDFATDVRAALLTGLSTATSGVIAATDSVLGALGKLQAQVTAATNGPKFKAFLPLNSSQTLSSGVWTKVQLSAEAFDSTAAFDTSSNRFFPTRAGYYQINGVATIGETGITQVAAAVYKNGQPVIWDIRTMPSAVNSIISAAVSDVVYLNGSTDYVELWAFGVGSTVKVIANTTQPNYVSLSACWVGT